MPTLSTYKKLLGAKTIGQARKADSDMVVENTWDRAIETRIAYFYDIEIDEDPFKLVDMKPENNPNKIPISVKYLENSSQTYAKDTVTYHLQFKPSEDFSSLTYYKKAFADRWDAECPVGSYVDIPDNKGIYRRWLIVGLANYYNAQFSTYEILPCNYTFNFCDNGEKIDIAGVTRTQSSYTAGVWRDQIFQSPDDTMKFVLPLNEDTARLSYNKRVVIDTKVDIYNADVKKRQVPRVFSITKVDRLDANGLCLYTIKQDLWNEETDYIHYEVEGDPSTIKGKYADYYSGTPVKEEEPVVFERAEFVVSGDKPELKVGGGVKKITVKIFEGEGEVPFIEGLWSYTIDGEDVTDLLIVKDHNANANLAENQIQIKFRGDNSYIGKTLKVKYSFVDDKGKNRESTLDLSIVGL